MVEGALFYKTFIMSFVLILTCTLFALSANHVMSGFRTKAFGEYTHSAIMPDGGLKKHNIFSEQVSKIIFFR